MTHEEAREFMEADMHKVREEIEDWYVNSPRKEVEEVLRLVQAGSNSKDPITLAITMLARFAMDFVSVDANNKKFGKLPEKQNTRQ